MGVLSSKSCKPCKKGTPALDPVAAKGLLSDLPEGWRITGGKKLEKEFKFPNFKEALAFTNKVGEIAEREGHHPDIQLGWGRVKLEIWTHSVGGLSENDFILAAKADD
jgi:4a-hydroxytetrahydrobiopterin dehydratase